MLTKLLSDRVSGLFDQIAEAERKKQLAANASFSQLLDVLEAIERGEDHETPEPEVVAEILKRAGKTPDDVTFELIERKKLAMLFDVAAQAPARLAFRDEVNAAIEKETQAFQELERQHKERVKVLNGDLERANREYAEALSSRQQLATLLPESQAERDLEAEKARYSSTCSVRRESRIRMNEIDRRLTELRALRVDEAIAAHRAAAGTRK